jgi:hypothetical protein
MDSRVPGVPKDGALEAREAKFIETGPAGAERTPASLRGIFEAKSAPFGKVGWMSSPPLRCAGLRCVRRLESKGERWEAIMLPPTLCNGVLLRGRDSRWITGSGARLCRL